MDWLTGAAAWLAQMAVLLAIPLLIALCAPRRLRLGLAALWAVCPLLVLIAMAGVEVFARGAGPGDGDKLLFGLLLIGTIGGLPWLVCCCAGYATGAFVRSRFRPVPLAGGAALSSDVRALVQIGPSGTSSSPLIGRIGGAACGLKFEVGPGSLDERAPRGAIRIVETTSRRVLFDASGWPSSELEVAEDGAWLLSLRQGDWETLFRIDPETMTFVELAADRRGALEDLPARAAEALAEANEPANACRGRRPSRDGRWVVDLESVEWAASDWVRSPRLRSSDGEVLFDLFGTDWDATTVVAREATVQLALRRYRHGGEADVEIDLNQLRYSMRWGERRYEGRLDQFEQALDAAWHEALATSPGRPLVPGRRAGWREWRRAFVILLIAIDVIAMISVAVVSMEPSKPTRRLDRIPEMPSGRMTLER